MITLQRQQGAGDRIALLLAAQQLTLLQAGVALQKGLFVQRAGGCRRVAADGIERDVKHLPPAAFDRHILPARHGWAAAAQLSLTDLWLAGSVRMLEAACCLLMHRTSKSMHAASRGRCLRHWQACKPVGCQTPEGAVNVLTTANTLALSLAIQGATAETDLAYVTTQQCKLCWQRHRSELSSCSKEHRGHGSCQGRNAARDAQHVTCR